MSNLPHQPSRIEDVLERIETRERSKSRRKQVLYVVAAILLMGGGAFAFSLLSDKPEELTAYSFAALTPNDLETALQNDYGAILVKHPDLGTETVRSVEDYETLAKLAEAYARLNQAETDQVDSTQRLEVFSVDIAGTREAGEALAFTIESYDPEVEYILDFGNGYRRQVNERYTYRYPRAGTFEVRLLATKGEASSMYSKRFSIRRAQNEQNDAPAQQEAPTQIADNATEENETVNELPEGAAEPSIDPDLSLVAEATQVEPMDLRAGGPNAPDPEISESVSLPTPSNSGVEGPAEAAETPASQPTNTAMLISEIEPQYPGGSNAMVRFIRRNFRYPSRARDAGAEGVVITRFVVGVDGKVSGITIVKGIGYGCDEEAIRLIKKMPRWIPGEQNGRKVPVYRTIPITFRLLN